MAVDFRFSYLLIKYRKVSGSDDTRNQFARKRTRVRIPSSPPNKTDADRASVPLFLWRDSNGSVVNDLPVAGQSRPRPSPQARANPYSAAKREKHFIEVLLSFDMKGVSRLAAAGGGRRQGVKRAAVEISRSGSEQRNFGHRKAAASRYLGCRNTKLM